MPSRVLIVEDSRTIRSYIRQILISLGADVVGEAPDGIAGVEYFKSLKPDMTLLDINMPRLDGLGAFKQIRAEDPKAHVVMLTSVNSAGIVQELLEAGVDNFLLKDASRQQLTDELRKALSDLQAISKAP